MLYLIIKTQMWIEILKQTKSRRKVRMTRIEKIAEDKRIRKERMKPKKR